VAQLESQRSHRSGLPKAEESSWVKGGKWKLGSLGSKMPQGEESWLSGTPSQELRGKDFSFAEGKDAGLLNTQTKIFLEGRLFFL
jgi:hypothetical protein